MKVNKGSELRTGLLGKLGGLGDMLGKARGNNITKSLPLEKILRGVLNKLGIKMHQHENIGGSIL